MHPRPVQLAISGESRLKIVWSDGHAREYSFRELSENCPCASCREKKSAQAAPNPLAVLSPAEAQPLRLVEMTPVGSYAYKIVFLGGCTMGIYTFDLLRQLGEPAS